MHNYIFVIHSVRHSNIYSNKFYFQYTLAIHSLYIRYTFSFTSLYIEFHNQIFIIHSVSHSQTQHFTIISSLYTQFQIQRYNISQLDIRYTFSFTFLNIALHNYIFVIHSIRHSNIYSNQFYFHYTVAIHSLYIQFQIPIHRISQLDIRYTFSFTFLKIALHIFYIRCTLSQTFKDIFKHF